MLTKEIFDHPLRDRVTKGIFGYMPEVPYRKIRDPNTLKALAHRVRVQLYDELLINGPATAADLAKRIGQTQANCSYHLRQMQRYGFIEEVAGAKGRQRPWQAAKVAVSVDLYADDSPAQQVAVKAVWDVLLEQEIDVLRRWRAARLVETGEWRDAAEEDMLRAWMTAEELKAFSRDLYELAKRHVDPDRIDPENRPPGSRPVRIVAWAIPVGEEAE